jgi:transcriptional regulator GlxA family with amidase domain
LFLLAYLVVSPLHASAPSSAGQASARALKRATARGAELGGPKSAVYFVSLAIRRRNIGPNTDPPYGL